MSTQDDLFVPASCPVEATPPRVRELSIGQQNKRAFLIDQFVDAANQDALHEHFKKLPYRFIDYDRDDTEFLKHLVHYFSEEDYQSDPFIAQLLARAGEFLNAHGIATQGVERIYANFNLFGDFQLAHADGDVWTALMFVNARWNADWGGDFLLYEEGADPIALAIPPKPGRMVIFDGTILHRGGVPSKFCLDARISLAIKFNKG